MNGEDQERHDARFHFFVDGLKYVTDLSSVTGAYIISQLPTFESGYTLWEESKGDAADKQIQDNTSVDLTSGPRQFYTVPPANFGAGCYAA